jgi:uncharacterized protein
MKLYKNMEPLDIDVLAANTFMQRAGGLLFRRKLTNTQCLRIKPCNSVHTCGMTYALDILYLDKVGIILKIIKNMKPYRISYCTPSSAVLEFVAGESERLNLQVGNQLFIK